jgi:hypothetical protein
VFYEREIKAFLEANDRFSRQIDESQATLKERTQTVEQLQSDTIQQYITILS